MAAKRNKKLITIDNLSRLTDISDRYNYQLPLTSSLESKQTLPFTQEVINEIVLWKTDRYAEFTPNLLEALNNVSPIATFIDDSETITILKILLGIHGVALPMASTILKFRNPSVYQIIDQRAYRVIYGEPLKLRTQKTDKSIVRDIEVYLTYLSKLRNLSQSNSIPFEKMDRILYLLDIEKNSNVSIH